MNQIRITSPIPVHTLTHTVNHAPTPSPYRPFPLPHPHSLTPISTPYIDISYIPTNLRFSFSKLPNFENFSFEIYYFRNYFFRNTDLSELYFFQIFFLEVICFSSFSHYGKKNHFFGFFLDKKHVCSLSFSGRLI
jgi:hypothetical protein